MRLYRTVAHVRKTGLRTQVHKARCYIPELRVARELVLMPHSVHSKGLLARLLTSLPTLAALQANYRPQIPNIDMRVRLKISIKHAPS